ncbi:MAG: hypothetical protein ACRC6N_07345, partial [Plesiomonas sp.]|uniref:hypothetical protein n=1 Tax=Plesiomonas sp. TaxID=2486279 RepID=UPI003F316A01
TADGKPIAHANLIGQLTEAVQLPLEVAIVKVKGHASGEDEQAIGNRKAHAGPRTLKPNRKMCHMALEDIPRELGQDAKLNIFPYFSYISIACLDL